MKDPRFDYSLASDADVRTVTDQFMISTPKIQRGIVFKLTLDKMALSELLASALAHIADAELRSRIEDCIKDHG